MLDIPARASITITPAGHEPAPNAIGPRALTAALNAFTVVGATLPGLAGESVDIINNLTAGTLQKRVPGAPPVARARAFELGQVPDGGAGDLPLGQLDPRPGAGAVTLVNDAGTPAAVGAATGVRLTGGAYLIAAEPIAQAVTLDAGWALSLTVRAPAGALNSGKTWVAIGRRYELANYGISITETSSGALQASIEDPRQTRVRVTSAALPRDTLHSARIEWSAVTRTAQWFVGGVASGAPVALDFVAEIAAGRMHVGTSLALSTTGNPTGSIHRIALEARAPALAENWVAVGSVETMGADEARSLRIDTSEILTPIAAAGAISLRYFADDGESGEDITVSIGGYANLAQQVTRYIGAEMPFAPIDLGTMLSDRSALVLTPPSRGKIQTRASTEYYAQGAFIPLIDDGIPERTLLLFQPQRGGTSSGNNPAGATTRAFIDTIRLQQGGTGAPVTQASVVEMNRAPKLAGGGEAWGHADDQWVPIHALVSYDSGLIFPTIVGEVPVVTLDAVPGVGEGVIRLGRTGPDLAVGATIPFAEVARLGWWKPGISTVSAACKFTLRLTAPGAPVGVEDYRLLITDAPRPAAFGRWEQATAIYADEYTRLRWAARGGDWAGSDGAWGAVPYASAAGVTSARTLSIDVTAMVKAHGAEVFATTNSSGSIALVPPNYTPDSTKEPVLVVTGGPRAGSYKATRRATVGDSATTSWRASYTSVYSVRRGLALLLAFDGAGTAAELAGATSITLTLVVTATTSGGGTLQLFRPAPLPPRPGPRVVAVSTPAASRADLLLKVETDAEWTALLAGRGSNHPNNFTIANGCYYGAIPTGHNTGLARTIGFWKPGGAGGYPVIRVGRMIGWHTNYQPADANRFEFPGFSGKSPGPFATLDEDLSEIEAGRGGIAINGYNGYTCRTQRGSSSVQTHISTSPLHRYLAFGDYNYYMSGNTNGETIYGVAPLPRMAWVWLETVHAVNSVSSDGRWANDGVFAMHVNGRKYCETRRLEYRVGGNKALWDAYWFDEYNGGTDNNRVDRPWPFVVGPTYIVSGDAAIAPPAGWNAPFVDANGAPGAALPYLADF